MTQTFNEDVVFNQGVKVDGNQDIPQLRVEAHTTQNQPLQTWQDSGGNVLARITADGRLQEGNLGLGTPPALVEANDAITLPSAKPKQGWQSLGRLTGALTDAITWVVHELELLGAGGASGIHTALRAKLTHQNTGNAANAELRAGDFQAVNQSGTSGTPVGRLTALHGASSNGPGAYLAKAVGVEATVSNDTGGSITEAAAFEVAAPTNTGTIGTLYGLRIPDLTQGTTNVAIQTGQGMVRVGDHEELKVLSSAPTANPPADFVKVYPKLDAGVPKLYAKDAAGVEHNLVGSSGHTIQNNGTNMPAETKLNFKGGSNVTLTLADNAGASSTDITIAASGVGGSGSYPPSICEGRLTLESGVPVSVTDQTAKTTLYFTPYKGNLIGTYSGSAWSVNAFTEKSLDISGYTTNKNYDIFIVDSTLALEGLVWTDNATRATALTLQDGIYVKSGAATRRYLGTIRITGTTGQCEDSSVRRFVNNYYNPTPLFFRRIESTVSWTYGPAGWRAWNNSNANRVEFVCGQSTAINLMFHGEIGGNTYGFLGLKLDGTSSADRAARVYAFSNPNAVVPLNYTSNIGYHYVQAMENAQYGWLTLYGGDMYGIDGWING